MNGASVEEKLSGTEIAPPPAVVPETPKAAPAPSPLAEATFSCCGRNAREQTALSADQTTAPAKQSAGHMMIGCGGGSLI